MKIKIILISIISIIIILFFRVNRFDNFDSIYRNNILYKIDSFDDITIPKIAFLFLTYNNIKRPDIWNKFFDIDSNNNTISTSKYANKFTIYNHAKEPEKVSDLLLKDKHIPEHIDTCWGCFGTVEANILMMKEALKDKNNTKFILVSDSCIPIVSFDKLYNEIMKDNKSNINIFYNQEQRYNNIINPSFTKDKFTKHAAQGLIFNINHTQMLVNSLYKYKTNWENVGCVDEHYFSNVLRELDYNFELNNNNIKYTFDIWEINILDNNSEIIINDTYYALIKYITNKAIDKIRNKNFLLMRKVDNNTEIDINYINI